MEVDQIGPLQFDILTTPGIRNTVTWNANGCEGPGTTVPTRRSSWGAVKATYR
jgi:hypothetical protein